MKRYGSPFETDETQDRTLYHIISYHIISEYSAAQKITPSPRRAQRNTTQHDTTRERAAETAATASLLPEKSLLK